MGNFYSVLKSLRTVKGMTQEELAKALNISRSTVGMYENGSREPDYETLEAIADYFNVDIDYLLGRTNLTTRMINPFSVNPLDTSEPTYTLTPKEEVLVSDFRTLNDQGQDYILQTMDMVKDKYKKSADVSGMEKIG